MKKLIGLSLIVLGLATACTASNTSVRNAFPDAEYAQLNTTGNAVIHGKVFLEAKDGDILPKAANKVILNPVTTYSIQWYETARMKEPLEAPDPRLAKYVREQTTDPNGRFEFRDVPTGEYFLVTPLTWEGPWPVGDNSSTTTQGRFVVRRIAVQSGDNLTVSLNSSIRSYAERINMTQPEIPKWSVRTF